MQNIKKLYLYAVSLISLVILVIASVMLINLGLKTFIFTKADRGYDYYAEPCNSYSDFDRADADCSDEAKTRRAEEQRERRNAQKQSDAATALAMILVAAPVFYYHWRLAKKEK